MFLKKIKSKGYVYLSIVESYRENDQVKHRTLFSLGRMDQIKNDPKVSEIIRILSSEISDDFFHLDDLKELQRLNWGASYVYRSIWNVLNFDSILDKLFAHSKITFDYKEAIFLEIISRLTDPCSKLKLYQNQDKFYGTKNVYIQHLYRILDYLADFQDELEKLLFLQRKEKELELVFYDVTTLYFESVKGNDLKDFGYSKDCKFSEVQVVLVMLVDSNGNPISCGIFPGNTFESKTLEDTLKKLKNQFNIKNITIVADRGINSKLNLKKIKDSGFEYIVGCRLKILNKNLQKEILSTDKYELLQIDDIASLKYRKIPYQNIVESQTLEEDLHCTWSLKRAEKDRKDRDRLVHKAETMLRDHKYDSKRGANKYLKKEKRTASLDIDKIAEDAKWDGFYGIQTSNKNITSEEVLNAYHRLWKIEESFKIMKSSLKIRPMFHWTAKRIKGHIVLCFLAFMMHRTLEQKLIGKKLNHSPENIQSAINELEASILEIKNQKYFLTSQPKGLSKEILNLLKIQEPKKLTKMEVM